MRLTVTRSRAGRSYDAGMRPSPDLVTIRPATPDDAPALGRLHIDVWEDAYTGLLDQSLLDDRRADVEGRIRRWREILTEDHRTVLAEAAEGLVGFAGAGPGRDHDLAPEPELELYALYVRAAWWGAGVGHALLGETIGDRAAYLWVLAGNSRALAFYERQGFRLDGTEDEHDEGLHVRMVRT
jgi:ribosomal protein S18 acetylase RimI-like enzyme